MDPKAFVAAFSRLLRLGSLCLMTLMPMSGAFAQELADDARLYRKFSLLPGKYSNRYVLYFPFEVTRPGRIRIHHEVTGADLKIDKSASLPDYVLVDARAFDKIDPALWFKVSKTIVDHVPTLKLEVEALKVVVEGVKDLLDIKDDKPKWYHGSRPLLDKKAGSLTLDVDDRDLRTTQGRYVLILRNPSPGEYHGNVLISYPGDAWVVDPALEAADPRKPDLAVERLELDADNRVLVTVSNRGPGWLHRVRYSPAAERPIRLSIEVDGREAASVPLATVDKQFALSLSGGSVTYRSDVQLTSAARVSAAIDADEVVAEMDERNNRRRETLTPRSGPAPGAEPGHRVKRGAGSGESGTGTGAAGLPDLSVTDMFLDERKRVVVRIINNGGGLAPELYQGPNPVRIRLLMNGAGWTSMPLAFFDPRGVLKQPGGIAVWTMDEPLRGAADITVIVDEGNVCQESDKANNTLTRRLAP